MAGIKAFQLSFLSLVSAKISRLEGTENSEVTDQHGQRRSQAVSQQLRVRKSEATSPRCSPFIEQAIKLRAFTLFPNTAEPSASPLPGTEHLPRDRDAASGLRRREGSARGAPPALPTTATGGAGRLPPCPDLSQPRVFQHGPTPRSPRATPRRPAQPVSALPLPQPPGSAAALAGQVGPGQGRQNSCSTGRCRYSPARRMGAARREAGRGRWAAGRGGRGPTSPSRLRGDLTPLRRGGDEGSRLR